MKAIFISMIVLMTTGCATTNIVTKEQIYYEAAKSISRDNAMTQTACWAAITEIAKTGDNTAKIGALALADKCKNVPIAIEAPKKSFFDFFVQ